VPAAGGFPSPCGNARGGDLSKNPIIIDFRWLIRHELDRKGLTLSDLAASSGVPRTSLSAYLSGRRDMTGSTIERLLAALGLRFNAA